MYIILILYNLAPTLESECRKLNCSYDCMENKTQPMHFHCFCQIGYELSLNDTCEG